MHAWNLWHGCHKISAGCRHCYMFRQDAMYERDSTVVAKTNDFDLPMKRKRDGSYKIPSGTEIYTCLTSDFFLEDADEWRPAAWSMIRARHDVHFSIITKRIHRFVECLPQDWGSGYENVSIGCTVENQEMADFRLPIFLNAPICHRFIVCEPLLEQVDLSNYLSSDLEFLIAGGESGTEARPCDFDWILSLRDQCRCTSVPFRFKQTGRRFVKDGKLYLIARKYQHEQAKKAGIDLDNGIKLW